MRVFFDNCTSPVLAEVLDAYVKHNGGSAHHIRTMQGYGFSGETTDVDWIKRLSDDKPKDWIVVTNDDRIRRQKQNRSAWLRAGLRGFVLASSFQKMPTNRVASVLLWRWPDMENIMELSAPGSLFELPENKGAGFRPLSV